jgi:TRAF-interacting protein
MERKKDCPQCRSKCTNRNIFRIYFNNLPNLDSSQVDSATLIDKLDNLTLAMREKEMKMKTIDEEKTKLESTLSSKEKKIKTLDEKVASNNQLIATMRHEMDLLRTHRSSFLQLENENCELKSKLELMAAVESVLMASQGEIDDVLKQKFSYKDLCVMVGTLRRELSCNELRKNEIRKQNQILKNDLRAQHDERKKLEDKISFLESENHRMTSKFQRIEMREECDTPENVKKPRLALNLLDDQNTPSPLSRSELEGRVKMIQESESPYWKVKSSSLGLGALKPPKQIAIKEKSSSSSSSKLSIFQKPRITDAPTKQQNENLVFNGIGGTSKVLQSDLIVQKPALFKPQLSVPIKQRFFKKNLSASALGKQ